MFAGNASLSGEQGGNIEPIRSSFSFWPCSPISGNLSQRSRTELKDVICADRSPLGFPRHEKQTKYQYVTSGINEAVFTK